QAGTAAGRVDHGVGEGPVALHRDLEGHGLLPFDPIRLPQRAEVEAIVLGREGPGGLAAVADVTLDECHCRSEATQLRDNTLRSPVWADDVCGNACAGSVS